MKENRIFCFVLDAVLEDYHPVWEILSSLKERLNNESEDHAIDFLVDALNILLNSNCIAMYQGYTFQGEQKNVGQFQVDRQFILNHQHDWKNKDYRGIDYRIAITDKGINFLDNNCSSHLFEE